MYLACVTTDATFAEIGRRFGGRDQSIVRMCARACDRAAAGNENDARLFDTLKALRETA
jgi:chromosomal replication initiation ATPase DnaA